MQKACSKSGSLIFKCLTVDILRGKILVEVDFKQNIRIGISPRQQSYEYFESDGNSRSVLGNSLVFKNAFSNQIGLNERLLRFWCLLR